MGGASQHFFSNRTSVARVHVGERVIIGGVTGYFLAYHHLVNMAKIAIYIQEERLHFVQYCLVYLEVEAVVPEYGT